MAMKIVGIMGPGETASEEEMETAFEMGKAIALQGWVLLTGGRSVGIMDSASRGAKAGQGIVVGILPGSDADETSSAVDIPILTGMGEARDNINVLSSRLLFFIGMNPGTACELALALKHRKPAVLVRPGKGVMRFFGAMGKGILEEAEDVASAIAAAKRMLPDLQ